MNSQATLETLLAQNRALKEELENLRVLEAQKLGIFEEAKEEAKEEAENKADDLVKYRELFNYYDSDKSGFIDVAEFQFLVYDLGEVLTDDEVQAALTVIDTHNNGKISFDDFVSWWKSERPVNNKIDTQVSLLKLKLRAKALQRSALQITQRVQHADSLASETSTRALMNFVVGDFHEGPAAMSISITIKHATQEALELACRTYGGEPNTQFIIMDLALKDNISEEERKAVLAFLIADGGNVQYSLEEIRAGEFVIRGITKQRHGPSRFPAGVVAEPLQIEFKYPFEHFLTNPDAKLSDLLNFRLTSNSYIADFLAFLKKRNHRLAPLFMLFAGLEVDARVGSLRDIMERFRQFLADHPEKFPRNHVDFGPSFNIFRTNFDVLSPHFASYFFNASSVEIRQWAAAAKQLLMERQQHDQSILFKCIKGLRTVRVLNNVDFNVDFHNFNIMALFSDDQ